MVIFDRLKILFSKTGKSREVDEGIEWEEFQKSLNYVIKKYNLFKEALTHRSYFSRKDSEKIKSNERLEFLGDAVINLVVAELLYEKYPDINEGELTKKRAILVSRKILSEKSNDLNLGKFVLIGDCEEKTGGRQKVSILTDTLEAVIGAIYIEKGYKKVRDYLKNTVYKDFEEIFDKEEVRNFKGELLEYIQKVQHKTPKYFLKKEEGPDHYKTYTVNVKIGNKIFGTGKGRSKKVAEQKAAEKALEKIKNLNEGK
ncbi:ribonuclease III [candidate division KSB1 bacterium]|nr:MAG: ribonuclease III [candidate division KSB1 bacterium]